MKKSDEEVRDVINGLDAFKENKNPDIKDKIIFELAKSIEILGGMSDILCIVCSYSDTMSNSEALKNLKDWNNVYSKFKLNDEFSPIYKRQ